MKQIELNLQKRLLIVEDAENGTYFPPIDIDYHIEKDDEVWKLICKGAELTEEIADEFAEPYDLVFYASYDGYKYSYEITALESFISAIEAKQIELGIKIDLSKSLIFEIL